MANKKAPKSGHWIQGAIKRPGALRKKLGAKPGQPIPAAKLEKAAHSTDKRLADEARLAIQLGKMSKKGTKKKAAKKK